MERNIIENAELIIFDFDGTLYEDTDHFVYYSEQLKKQLLEEVRPLYTKEYEKIVSGEHVVTIGKVYDVVRDYVLKLDPVQSTVGKAWTWKGKELEADLIQKLYPESLNFDSDTMIAISDGWQLPNVCAKHFGLQDTQSAYVQTKNFMATDQFHLTKITGLREALIHLKEKKNIVLLTNSQKENVHRILQNIDLQDIFENIITEANKPLDTKKHFLDLLQKFNIRPEKGLSIGDNYINDIAPAINIGMQSVYIDLYESEYPEYNGRKVKSISELIKEMNSL